MAAILVLAIPGLRQQAAQLLPQNIYLRQGVVSYAYGVNRAAPAVVNIYTQSMQQAQLDSQPSLQPQRLGSGVIMNRGGYILTNYHVIARANQIIVALQDGRIVDAKLIGTDVLTDLALLKIKANNLPVIPQDNNIDPQVGDVVLAIGNPFNVGQTITQGIISAKGRSDLSSLGADSNGRQDFLQTDAAVNEGNSGGALINTRGELVGISTATYHTTRNQEGYGISFAVPYKLALDVMKQLIEHGRVIRGYLGVGAIKPSAIMARLLNLGDNQGLVINHIVANSPADKAGIKINDVLLAINNQPIQSASQVLDKVAAAKPGSILSLTISRQGKKMTVPVTITEDTRYQSNNNAS